MTQLSLLIEHQNTVRIAFIKGPTTSVYTFLSQCKSIRKQKKLVTNISKPLQPNSNQEITRSEWSELTWFKR